MTRRQRDTTRRLLKRARELHDLVAVMMLELRLDS